MAEIVGTLRAQLGRRGALRILIISLLALELGYVFATNLILAAGAVQRLSEGNESVKVDFDRAWTPWPGKVFVSNLRLQIQDSNMQFEVEIPRVDVKVNMWALLHRTFEASRVRGSGVVFHFRQRIARESLDEPWVRELPSISGFDNPASFQKQESAPTPTDEAYDRLWTVHLENVDVGVSDIWIQMFRFEGNARALGAFRLQPARRLWVGPAELRIVEGRLDRGAQRLMDVVGGSVSCTVRDFDIRPVNGWDVLAFINANVDLQAETVRLGETERCPWMEADAANFEGRIAGQATAFRLESQAKLERASFKWGRFRAHAARAALSTTWTGDNVSTDINVSALRLRNAGGPPRGWKADVPSVALRTKFRIDDNRLQGPARLEARSITAQVGKTQVKGDLIAGLDLGLREPSYRVADLGGTVEARRVAMRSGGREVTDWWAKLDLRKTHLDTRRNFDVNGRIAAEFKDALPVLYVLVAERQIPKWSSAVVPRQAFDLDLHVERVCRWTDVQLVEASTGHLKLAGRVQSEPGAIQGAFLFRLAPLSLGLRFDEEGSDTSLFAGKGWLERQLSPLEKAAAEQRAHRCPAEPTSCD